MNESATRPSSMALCFSPLEATVSGTTAVPHSLQVSANICTPALNTAENTQVHPNEREKVYLFLMLIHGKTRVSLRSLQSIMENEMFLMIYLLTDCVCVCVCVVM